MPQPSVLTFHPQGRHLADKRSPSTGTRTAQFLRLSRPARDSFHASQSPAGPSRLKQFLRIARGRGA
jgi:hypothetical protein